MARIVIAVTHRKGGVGKTTTTATLATGCAALGHATLAIDLDPQGSLAGFLGCESRPDLYDLLVAREPAALLRQKLCPVKGYQALALIRGDDETLSAVDALASPHAKRTLVQALNATLEAIGGNGRTVYVFLDTPPGLGHLQMAALTVADYLLIPVHAAYASEEGLPKVAAQVQELRQVHGRGARLLGLLPTRVKTNTVEHRSSLQALHHTFPGLVYPIVRDTTGLERCPRHGVPIWDHEPKGIGAQDYARVLHRLMSDLGGESQRASQSAQGSRRSAESLNR